MEKNKNLVDVNQIGKKLIKFYKIRSDFVDSDLI